MTMLIVPIIPSILILSRYTPSDYRGRLVDLVQFLSVKHSILTDPHDVAVSRGAAMRSIWISLYTASRPGSDGGSGGLLKIIGSAGACYRISGRKF